MGFGLKNTAALADRRRGERQGVSIDAIARPLGGEPLTINIEVLSSRGFLAKTEKTLPQGTILRVAFPSGRAPHARIVWLEAEKIGCEFLDRVALDELLAAPEVGSTPRRRIAVQPDKRADGQPGQDGPPSAEPKRFDRRQLEGAIFQDCLLAQSTVRGTSLAGSLFSNVDFQGAKLTHVNMSGVSIEDANIEGLTIHGYDILALIRAELARKTGR